MRHVALLLLLCGCVSLSSEQNDQLASHQRNAKYYFEGGKFDQAMGQIERGLEIAPDDYLLNALRGVVLLKQSGSALSTDHRILDEATQALASVYDTRSPNRHEPYLLLNYALALQKQGRRRLGEELRLRGQASRAPEKDELLAQADVQRAEGRELLGKADELLQVLIERGEVLRIAHNHRLQIAQDLGDDAAFADAAKAYLDQSAKDQETARREIERTTEATYETEQLRSLRTMRDEELEVRALLAEHHYARRQYETALTQLNRVLEIDPQRSVDYYNRARVLMELGRTAEAKADFRKFLATTRLPASNEKTTLAMKALDQ